MQVVYHLGAHCTDEDRLYRTLLKNKGELGRRGIITSGPGRYRRVLREAINTLRGETASKELQEDILAAVMDEDHAERLVFSNEQFVCAAQKVLAENRIYPQMGEKTAWFSRLFPDADTEFFVALRNPATFIPALFERTNEDDFAAFIAGVNPVDLRWSETLARMRTAAPGARIVTWCNEDSALIWPDILHSMAGLPPEEPLDGELDFIGSLMVPEGIVRMESYLASHPVKTGFQRQRVTSAFLDKYALPEAIEEEIDLPGWTIDLVDRMTAIYVEDCHRISQMDGIEMLTP